MDKVEVKVYLFEVGDQKVYIIATNPMQAINYYFHNYTINNDLGLFEGKNMFERGITIRELSNEEVRKPVREIRNLDRKEKSYSLFDLLKEELEIPDHTIPTWILSYHC